MIHSSKYLIFKDFGLFESLSDMQIEQISNQALFEKSKKGELLYDYGDTISNIYIVYKGSVKIGMNTSSDKVMIKEIIYKNELLGENIISANNTRKEFAQAISDVEYFKIPAPFFKSLLEKNPVLCQAITEILIKKMSSLEDRMSNFVFKKAHNRITDFLKELATKSGIKIGLDEILINHGLSHKEIANITDTSRQTVARVLGELKKANLIHFSSRKPNKILIRNIMNLS